MEAPQWFIRRDAVLVHRCGAHLVRWQIRLRVGAPLWSPCGVVVEVTWHWCSAVEPMWWGVGCGMALVLRCGAYAVGWWM